MEKYKMRTCSVCKTEYDCPGLKLRHHFGYGSIYDGSKLKANLCPDCTDQIVHKMQEIGRENGIELQNIIKE